MIENNMWVEWVGYAAMGLLMYSFLHKDFKKFRVWNSLGCGIFIIYGFLISSIPIMITNIFILSVNIYYLYYKKS